MTVERLDTRHGVMFVPDTDNGQYWWIKNSGASPEEEYIEMVCAILDERPKGVALDAGANFGCWTLPLARHAHEVIAFEPQRCIARLLQQTMRANINLPIRLAPVALGAEPGEIWAPDIDLNSTTNFGGVSLGVPHSEHPDAPRYDVPVLTLDGYLRNIGYGGAKVSFLKADVEGAEAALLQGAVQTITRYKPLLFVEADHPLTDTQALGRQIEAMGYNVEVLGNNFFGMPV